MAPSTEGRGTSVVAAAAAVAAEHNGCVHGRSLVAGVGGSEGDGLLEGVGSEGEGGRDGVALLDLLMEAMGPGFDAQEQVRKNRFCFCFFSSLFFCCFFFFLSFVFLCSFLCFFFAVFLCVFFCCSAVVGEYYFYVLRLLW